MNISKNPFIQIPTDEESTVQSESTSFTKLKEYSANDGTPNVRDMNEKRPVKVAMKK